MKKSVLIIIIVVAILAVLFFAFVLKKKKEAKEAAENGSNDDSKTTYTNTGSGAKTPATVRNDNWPLRKGSKGDRVKLLQVYLGGLTIDGDFGAKTEAAVKVAFGKPTVEINDLSANILTIGRAPNKEKSLNLQGNYFPLANGSVGYFVKIFQLSVGINPTGKYGSAEIAAAKRFVKSESVTAAQLHPLMVNKFFGNNLPIPSATDVKGTLDSLGGWILSGLKFGL